MTHLAGLFTGGFLFNPSLGLPFGSGGVAVLAGFIFCLGACLGSFANACAMRLVRNEDFVFATSRCRGCDKSLGWRENLPVLGFAVLRGRCACRDMRLPFRYVIVELLGGCLLLSYAATLPLPLAIGFGVAMLFVAIACLTDLEALTLHPALLTVFGLIGLGFAIAADFVLLLCHMGSAQALAGMVLSQDCLCWSMAFTAGSEAAMALERAISGCWPPSVPGLDRSWGRSSFLAACWLGAAVGVAMMATGRGSVMTKLPFGLFAGFVFILWPNILTRVF